MSAENYGRFYMLVEQPNGRQWICADRVEVTDGCLFLFHDKKGDSARLNAVFAPGSWLSCYAASVYDGDKVAVEREEVQSVDEQKRSRPELSGAARP
jgi:hypothetical protein